MLLEIKKTMHFYRTFIAANSSHALTPKLRKEHPNKLRPKKRGIPRFCFNIYGATSLQPLAKGHSPNTKHLRVLQEQAADACGPGRKIVELQKNPQGFNRSTKEPTKTEKFQRCFSVFLGFLWRCFLQGGG